MVVGRRISMLEKIKKSKLKGRGGAAFPVYLKWQALADNLAKKRGYLIVNCAEGEPNLRKDYFVLKHDLDDLFQGLFSALKYFKLNKIITVYFFIRQDYYNKFVSDFKRLLKQKKYQTLAKKLEFFIKPDKNDYLAGEETALLNIIEAKKSQPRLKPPFPSQSGLFSQPTLIHNVETWASIGQIAQDRYRQERIYHLRGKIRRPGLYKLPENLSAYQVLKETNNLPQFRYFAQIGGDACGLIVLDREMRQAVAGSASITIYPLEKLVIEKCFLNILKFHAEQSCGQCTPCREGTYRLLEEQQSGQTLNYDDLVFSLKETSLCAFGSSLAKLLTSFEKIRKE